MYVQIFVSHSDGVVALGLDCDNAAADVQLILGINSGVNLVGIARYAAAVGVEAAAADAYVAVAERRIVPGGVEDNLTAGNVQLISNAQSLALRTACHHVQLAAGDVHCTGVDCIKRTLVFNCQPAIARNVQRAVCIYRYRGRLVNNIDLSAALNSDIIQRIDGIAVPAAYVDRSAFKDYLVLRGYSGHVAFPRIDHIEHAAASERQIAPGHDAAVNLIIPGELDRRLRIVALKNYGANYGVV